MKRSEVMRRVRSKDTKPEMVVRKLVYSLGYRYRLHRDDLPGKPDLVFFAKKKIIFVHGCFWHGHKCKRGNRIPKNNRDYWINKIERNVARDEAHIKELSCSGWSVLVIWECELAERDVLQQRIGAFLNNNSQMLAHAN